ncbi:hypothetical protein QGP82_33855 [Leptothoe sp. LEGE 181152]|nr:hypothetical protein [Leptothoe sp. LEGE 181152]
MASIDAQKMCLYRQSAQKRAEQKEYELKCRHQWALSIAKEAAAILKKLDGFSASIIENVCWI